MARGEARGAPEEPQQGIEDLRDGVLADGLWGDRPLCPHGGKAAVPPQILPQGTQAGTAGRHREIFRPGALLLKGINPIPSAVASRVIGNVVFYSPCENLSSFVL
jgi:hypothetical protein